MVTAERVPRRTTLGPRAVVKDSGRGMRTGREENIGGSGRAAEKLNRS